MDTLLINRGKASLKISEQHFIRILLVKRSTDILALTKMWLDNTQNDVGPAVPGYNLFHKDQKSNIQWRSCAGGKVTIYACGVLEGKWRHDFVSDELGQICLEL